MTIVTLSPGTAITPADIAIFDARWMTGPEFTEPVAQAGGNLKDRSDALAWMITDWVTAMTRMYELTHDLKYLAHAQVFVDYLFTYRLDVHPDGVLVDEFRGRVVAGWGGPSPNRGGLNAMAEVVTSRYLEVIATYARIIVEDPALHISHGARAVELTNFLLATVLELQSQIVYREVGGFLEAFIKHLDVHATTPSAAQCEAAYQVALTGEPTKEVRWSGMRNNCNNLRRVAGRPMSHNENLAFAMAAIELWRVLEHPVYRQSPARSAHAEPIRMWIPLLVSRMQRYFVNRLQTIADDPAGERAFWNHADDLPNTIAPHAEDKHAALVMRYVDVLYRNLNRLNVVPASLGEPIALTATDMRRFANTFLQKIVRGDDFAANVAGKASASLLETNALADGWVQLAAIDPTIYHICHNVTLRADPGSEPIQPYLGPHNHSALLITKRYARRYLHYERSRQFGAPDAAGSPSVIVSAALGISTVVYRDNDGRLHELWQRGLDEGTSNLTYLSGNTSLASGDPRPYAAADGQVVALYRGTDDHVHSLYWGHGISDVGHDSLSRAAQAEPGVGNPVGFVENDGTSVVIYRSGGRHLRSLYWAGLAPPKSEDLSAPRAAPDADSDPVAYTHPGTGEDVVIYRGLDRHIYSLYWTTGAAEHADLSGVAGSPNGFGNPAAYYTPHNDMHQVTYRSDDGHLHELWWVGSDRVRHRDLTAEARTDARADSDPSAYYCADTQTKHVVYRDVNGHLHELSWRHADPTPTHENITQAAAAPAATHRPAACSHDGANYQSAIYRGTDGQIHEIRWLS